MKRFPSSQLLDQLHHDVHTIRAEVQQMVMGLTDRQLLQQPSPQQWSIAQCLEHLNSYGNYYLPKVEKAIQEGVGTSLPAQDVFTSSWLGNYFATSMKPGVDGNIQLKTKAFKNHTPASELNAQTVHQHFLDQQNRLTELLDLAKQTDIGKLRIPISLASWIKLSVGDTFRFLIAHEQRHILQAQRVYQLLFSEEVIR